jgi:hypothetical protein
MVDQPRHGTEAFVPRRAARNGPVVLVGHSLGGVSVSRVGHAVPHLLPEFIRSASTFRPLVKRI